MLAEGRWGSGTMPFRFEDQTLDTSRRELSRAGETIMVEPRVFDLLVYLIENRDRLVTKDDLIAHVWEGRIVSDSALTSAINAARKAVGDNGQDQRLIRTSARKGFRFVGDVRPAARQVATGGEPESALPVTRYAQSGDVNIAYQIMGTGPRDIVIVPGIISHVEYLHELPGYTEALRRLSAFARVITFDKRGTGLSDGLVETSSLEQRMDDVRAVMDAARTNRAALVGFSDGAAMSALFAATYPERVSHLILCGGLVKGLFRSPEAMEGMLSSRLRNWGDGAFVKIVASATRPVGAETIERFGRMERLSTSPGAFRALLLLNNQIDVTSILSTIMTPTLVLHRQTDAVSKLERGREAAALIPGATMIEYPEGDHAFWAGDTETLLGDIERFVTGGGHGGAIDLGRVLATVMSASMAGSSPGAAVHTNLGRQMVHRYRGTLVSTTGDSLVAAFDGPGRALRCALALTAAAKEIGLPLRAGLHTGEIETRDREIGGPAVQAAAHVMSQSQVGEVLVSRVVVDLVAGTGFCFTERVSRQLEALPGLQQLYAAIPS